MIKSFSNYLSILLVLNVSLSVQGMSTIKSWFVTPECFKDPSRSAERLKSYEDFKASTQKHALSWGKVTGLLYRSDGKDTCVLEKLGQKEKGNLYTQITNLLTQSKSKEFFEFKNLTASNQALHDAQNCLSIIRLGSYEETLTPEYKFAENALKEIEKNLDKVKEQPKPQTAARS